MSSELTTLCYIERDDAYLMLHRIKKKNDVNQDKWIGIGGHFEAGESPEECLLREAYEETGLTLTKWQFRGIVTFCFRKETDKKHICEDKYSCEDKHIREDKYICEYMHMYTASEYEGTLSECDEGELVWVPKEEVGKLKIWEGDRIFLDLLRKRKDFFSLKLSYTGDRLCGAALDGRPMELIDVRDAQGQKTGQTRERGLVHRMGTWHATSHVWIYRKRADGGCDVLFQKRSKDKDSFPGRFDISSAGHIPAGCDYKESALRELFEELGLAARDEELRFTEYVKMEVAHEFYGELCMDREMSAVYLLERDPAPGALRLQESEVEKVVFMDYETSLARIESGDEAFCVNPDEYRMLGNYF